MRRIYSLIVCFVMITSLGIAQKTESFKVMTYNIWNGFEWGKEAERKESLLNWVKEQNCDVIALQELCGYNHKKLKKDAKYWGHDYSVILKTDGYPVGLTSKHPIEIVERIISGMGHGALHCKTNGIDFMVVHLHPGSIKRRREETHILFNKLKVIMVENPSCVVLGDYNAHSPFDADLYDDDGVLLYRYREGNKGKGLDGNIANNTFDYAVISSFLSLKLEDVVQKYTQGLSQRGSFPTRVFESDDEKATPQQSTAKMERIDYILVSSELAKKCINAQVYNGKPTWFLSDHYPVIAEFEYQK